MDEKALMRAVKRAMDWAGSLPAKESVKLRPSDWKAICDLVLAPPPALSPGSTGSAEGWEDRALAAEAALAKAIVFELGEHHYVESRGDGTWAIKNGGCVLNVNGVWEYEPNPSNRTDEFIARTRFDRDDAFRRAAAIRAQGE